MQLFCLCSTVRYFSCRLTGVPSWAAGDNSPVKAADESRWCSKTPISWCPSQHFSVREKERKKKGLEHLLLPVVLSPAAEEREVTEWALLSDWRRFTHDSLIKIHDLDVAGLTVFGLLFFSLHDKFFSPSFFGSERWTYKSKEEKRINSSNQIHDPLNSWTSNLLILNWVWLYFIIEPWPN